MGKKQIPFDVEIEEERLQGWRQEPRLFALLNNMPGSQIMMRNEVKVLTNASVAYPAILEAMEKAERFIHFEFYTIRHDATGRKFQDVLMRKAREGVKVRCIFDGIGSYQLSEKFIGELKQAGCEVYFFFAGVDRLLR